MHELTTGLQWLSAAVLLGLTAARIHYTEHLPLGDPLNQGRNFYGSHLLDILIGNICSCALGRPRSRRAPGSLHLHAVVDSVHVSRMPTSPRAWLTSFQPSHNPPSPPTIPLPHLPAFAPRPPRAHHSLRRRRRRRGLVLVEPLLVLEVPCMPASHRSARDGVGVRRVRVHPASARVLLRAEAPCVAPADARLLRRGASPQELVPRMIHRVRFQWNRCVM
jgi:hypothetical protein